MSKPRKQEKAAVSLVAGTAVDRSVAERAIIDQRAERLAQEPRPPRVKVTIEWRDATEDAPAYPVECLAIDHKSPDDGWKLLAEALGGASNDFVDGLIKQVAALGGTHTDPRLTAEEQAEARERKINFVLSVVTSAKPRDQMEAMLAAQMATVHMASMSYGGRLLGAPNKADRDAAESGFNKLARTYAAQMDTLKRYRSKGEQRVVVEHVTVNEGGQAIVGAVDGTGGNRKGTA